MTFILLGISFLVFYALAMEAYRRQPVLIVKCNDFKPASDVYFHQIIQQGGYIPFLLYSEYLSNLATTYPLLHFHVFFLVDDAQLTAFRGPKRFMNKLIPYTPYITSRLEENNKREMREFQRKYQNVNITIGSLSNYMAMTPLKYKWRSLPSSHIPFYARVLSVWQNGGVGMDLNAFNDKFSSRQFIDRRISAILQQHNDGINPVEYTNALNKIDRDEEYEILSIFHTLVDQVLNDTRNFLTRLTAKNPQNETLIRTHRNKREISPVKTKNIYIKLHDDSKVLREYLNATNETNYKNEYQIVHRNESTSIKTKIDSPTPSVTNDSITTGEIREVNKSEVVSNESKVVSIKPNVSQVLLFYDFSLIPDRFGPPNVMPDTLLRPSFIPGIKNFDSHKSSRYADTASPHHLLSIDSEGLFISASMPLHPFLGYLISAGCQRMHPKYAIQDSVLTLCSGIFKDDASCNSIYFL